MHIEQTLMGCAVPRYGRTGAPHQCPLENRVMMDRCAVVFSPALIVGLHFITNAQNTSTAAAATASPLWGCWRFNDLHVRGVAAIAITAVIAAVLF